MTRGPSGAAASPEAEALALYQSYTRVTDTLRNSMGEAGCAALLARALACTERAHPTLAELRVLGEDGVRLEDIAASIAAHGREAIAAAFAALLDAILDVLTRLIGADMARQLIDDRSRRPPPPGGARKP